MPYKDPDARREYMQEYQRRWMIERRMEWINENGPCVDCGSWERLEVDHVDRSTKKLSPAALWGMSRTNPKRVAELAKCVARCYDCHKNKTIQEMSVEPQHGTNRMYNDGCRCDECREFKRLKNARIRNKLR